MNLWDEVELIENLEELSKKRNIEKSAFSKVNGLIILNFVVSGYILFIYIFIFISSLIK